jgi:hypothetical protein
LPDLEKLIARIFTYSIKHKINAIYFEDVSLSKLKEFRLLLKTLKTLPKILDSLLNIKKEDLKSKRLK